MTQPLPIEHDIAGSRFFATTPAGRAVCDYHRQGDTLLMTHTGVPPSLQGQGLAAALVEATLAWARAEKLKVRPLCSVVVAYMHRHPETHDLLER